MQPSRPAKRGDPEALPHGRARRRLALRRRDRCGGFAALKLQLKRAGTPIPLNDVWIAALALQHGATLFTHDRDFENIPQLLRVP
jgi:tRNA(fMet)-specific endonuclease VapC